MTLNILADRHHAGLYNSLQLLFERRLGYRLYTPTGMDWFTEDYWQFGKRTWGDDRLAVQFLNALPVDSEFPDYPIHGVTLAEAKEMRWDVVLATVDDNQQGFARFASDYHAKYAVHIGNTNQYVDWNLDPLALNASEMPLVGRGVHIGEEFDSDGLFAYSPPDGSHYIASFVNCMTSINCYPLLQRFEKVHPTHVHGIDGPDGVLKPIDKLAAHMRSSAFGYHDKEHGDGYGHVIHYWAAVGRPLIGHAFHYRDKIASSLWTPETCIDLNDHSPEEAAALVTDILNDPPRHLAMCQAIRAEFDKVTDWAGDAERVRELLA